MSQHAGKLRGRRLELALALTAATAWVLQGYDQSVVNGLLSLPQFERQFPTISSASPALEKQHSTLQGTSVALYEVGAAIGALSCFILGDKFGRKKTTVVAAVVVLVGVVLQTTAFGLPQLIVSRIVTGLGVGAFTATLPTWVGESVGGEHRGALVLCQGTGAIFGVMFVNWMNLGFYFTPHESQVAFRFPIAFQGVFAIIVLSAIPFLAESPRWLLLKDRLDEARSVLARLEDEPEESEIVSARMQVVTNSILADSQGHSHHPFAATPNKHLTRTMIAIGLNILAQMAGVNIITFYSNNIFQQDLGFSPVLSRVVSACLQSWQLVAAISALFLVDRFGRRKLLLVCGTLMAIANAGLAVLTRFDSDPAAAECSLVFYFLALGAFPVGLFLVPFLYSTELAPLPIRSQVTAMSGAANWLFNFLIAEVTPIGFSTIGFKYYLVYMSTSCLLVTFVYLLCPETKGRTLEDVDAIYILASSPFKAVSIGRGLKPGFAETVNVSEKVRTTVGNVENVAALETGTEA